MRPCARRKVEVYARRHEMEHLMNDLELSIMEHGSNIFLEVKVTYRRITRIYRTSSPSWSWACDIFVGMKIEYDLEKWYHLEKQKLLSMSLVRESYAKKIRTTPRTKNCTPSSSNLTRIIHVLKIGGRISF